MASPQTKEAIVKAAERLCAEQSFAEVQLRDIVAAAGVSLAAVNYHFGSKDELLAHVFLTHTTAMNRERLAELKQAEEDGGGVAQVEAILNALVRPALQWCLSEDRRRSTASRFHARALAEAPPAIKKILKSDLDHLRPFAIALRKSQPGEKEVDIYWGLHFVLAMVRHTINDHDRLMNLSDGLCKLDDLDGIVDRILELSLPAFRRSKRKANPLLVKRARR